jgi:hypothetical protein
MLKEAVPPDEDSLRQLVEMTGPAGIAPSPTSSVRRANAVAPSSVELLGDTSKSSEDVMDGILYDTAAGPPPLPEGWIAHLDLSSGQYYYIHLPTQSTQWVFPKGPTPLNMDVQS